MKKNFKIDTFVYFLSHYFVQSFLFKDLEKLAYDFRFSENIKMIDDLLDELDIIKKLNNWKYMRVLLKKQGESLFDDDEMNNQMIDILIYCLTDENWNPDTYKPFL